MRRINSVTYRRIKQRILKREFDEYMIEFEEELKYYSNYVLEQLGSDVRIDELHFEEAEDLDDNLHFIYTTNRSLN